jgi:chaperonin GroEL
MRRVPRPSVVFAPPLLAGLDTVVDAIKPTLGPLARTVVIDSDLRRNSPPEILDNAGVIARRIVEIRDPLSDPGAMLARQAICQMHDRCGDGGATLAVLAQAIAHQAHKALAAGAHPARLRHGIETGVARTIAALRSFAIQPPAGVAGRDMLQRFARTLSDDDTLAARLAEVVDIGGADIPIHIVNAPDRNIETEYVEGALWDAGWLAPGFGSGIARAENAAVIVVDGKLDNPQHMLTGLRTLDALGYRSVVLIADTLGDDTRLLLLQVHANTGMPILPIRIPGANEQRIRALQDITVLTGARPLIGGDAALTRLTEADVGGVRRAWVNDKQFGLIGGRRDPQQLRARIAAIRAEMAQTHDPARLAELRLRLGRMLGGVVVLHVGGETSRHQGERRDQAERLSRALQFSARAGLIGGGGTALLRAADAVQPHTELDADMAAGLRAVEIGLSAPMAALAANAGYDPSTTLHEAQRRQHSQHKTIAFDVRRGVWVDPAETGLLDATETLISAVQIAGSLTAMLVSTDAVVFRRNPPMAKHP